MYFLEMLLAILCSKIMIYMYHVFMLPYFQSNHCFFFKIFTFIMLRNISYLIMKNIKHVNFFRTSDGQGNFQIKVIGNYWNMIAAFVYNRYTNIPVYWSLNSFLWEKDEINIINSWDEYAIRDISASLLWPCSRSIVM